MLNFCFMLTLPYFKEQFKNLHCFSGRLTTNKSWEFQLYRHTYEMVGAELWWSVKCDHAGVKIAITLLTYTVCLQMYDNRHWNDELGTWCDI